MKHTIYTAGDKHDEAEFHDRARRAERDIPGLALVSMRDRDRVVVWMRKSGKTLKECGEIVGLSRERVRGLVRRYDEDVVREIRARKVKQAVRQAMEAR